MIIHCLNELTGEVWFIRVADAKCRSALGAVYSTFVNK